MLVEHLAFVEQYLHRGDQLIVTQRDVIEELQRDGHDIDQAEDLPEALERSKAILSDQRDTLIAEVKLRRSRPE
jgi:hypothetical protein